MESNPPLLERPATNRFVGASKALFESDIIKAFNDMHAAFSLGLRRGKHFRGHAGQADKALAKRRAANKVARVARRQAR